jgi:hypothetical protein
MTDRNRHDDVTSRRTIGFSAKSKRKMIANTIKLLMGWGISIDDFVAEWRKVERDSASGEFGDSSPGAS